MRPQCQPVSYTHLLHDVASYLPQTNTVGLYGTLTLDASGNYTYTLNNSLSAVQGLRDGMELIAVIMKAPTSSQRFEDAQSLLSYGFSTYALKTVTPDTPLPPVPVSYTHLDVYKRQRWRTPSTRSLRTTTPTPSPAWRRWWRR